jgi:transcriptional regulator with XRE-family HTH domain
MQQEISQKELADKCQLLGTDLGRDAIAKIEGGSRLVKDTELVLLAAILGSTPNELTSGRVFRPNSTA